MTASVRVGRSLTQNPSLGPLLYAGVLAALLLASWLTLTDAFDHYAKRNALADYFARLQKNARTLPHNQTATGAPPGSPFLSGPTVTVAGADLLKRVSEALAHVGGKLLSSQVNIKDTQAAGFVSVTINCEVDQTGVQQLLYDLEHGMPYLFVDRLELTRPEGEKDSARLHVLFTAAGRWLEDK